MKILVFGAGGHGKVIIDILNRLPDVQVAFVGDDRTSLNGTTTMGLPIVAPREKVVQFAQHSGVNSVIIAIGVNATREKVANWFLENGFTLGQAIHPASTIGSGVKIGQGSVVMAGAIINVDTHIGQNAIVNTGARIDHDCVVGNGVHVAPGSTLCGGVTVGNNVLLGAGCVILPNLSVAESAIVGAGSTVSHAVRAGELVVGVRARAVQQRASAV